MPVKCESVYYIWGIKSVSYVTQMRKLVCNHFVCLSICRPVQGSLTEGEGSVQLTYLLLEISFFN
jgi:hypothetical protein